MALYPHYIYYKTLNMYATVTLKKGREKALERKHPWIFSGAIYTNKQLKDGQTVFVADAQGEILATGHYHKASIAVRILAFEATNIDINFYKNKIQHAWNRRNALSLPNTSTNAFRLIAGEGDGLSGLIIDFYNNHLVIQCHTLAMLNDIELISNALQSTLPISPTTIYVKPIKVKNFTYEGQWLVGNTSSTTIIENNIKFEVNWETGQKTGFFLDQRINRLKLGQYAHNKTVLNTFCYSGGFSMYALKQGAKHVTSIDISQKAIDLTLANVTLNNFNTELHTAISGDTLKFLTEMESEQFDIIVLDPPAFAKSKQKSHNAIQAYKRLNALAFKKIKSGGIIFTFSCSQVIDKHQFEHTIRAAAIEVGRDIQIIEHLNQSPDHLINVYHTEGHYLKGYILMVQD